MSHGRVYPIKRSGATISQGRTVKNAIRAQLATITEGRPTFNARKPTPARITYGGAVQGRPITDPPRAFGESVGATFRPGRSQSVGGGFHRTASIKPGRGSGLGNFSIGHVQGRGNPGGSPPKGRSQKALNPHLLRVAHRLSGLPKRKLR